jgi:hypothetical protein
MIAAAHFRSAAVALAVSGGAVACLSSGSSAKSPSPVAAVVPAPSPKGYACNIVLGVSVTYDWFTSGFESYVDGARWEAMAPSKSKVAFIQNWSNPNDPIWTLDKLSPCAQNAATPERVIFTAVNWKYTSSAEWVAQLDAVVAVLQTKFPGVKEIDLLTMLRAPGNNSCGNDETVVKPIIDEAFVTIATKYPNLVRIGPKLEAPDCDVFVHGGPHFTPTGKEAVAKVYGGYYAQEQ